MFNWLKKVAQKRSFYQGASKTAANRDFNTAGNAPFETTALADRPVLRARARWMSANSPVMNNIDEAILNLAVGTGVKVQMRTDDSMLNSTIDTDFDRWCHETQWYDAQRVMLRSRMVDGEVFVYARPKVDGLEFQLIEADALDDQQMDGGIKRDSEGKPTSYRFKTIDQYGTYGNETVTISAEYIMHYFKRTRPTQQRGVSEYSQAMQVSKNLDAFNQSTVQSARSRASIAYVVQADGQIAGLDIEPNPDIDNQNIQYIGDVAVHYLKRGESISKTAPGSSDTEFGQFNETTTRQICTARNISYELGVSDASKTNYSSFRASLQKDNKRIAADQASQKPILDWMFAFWMEVEILAGRLKGVPYLKFAAEPWLYTKKIYTYPEMITVDPLKERLADAQAVKLNRTTQSILAHKAGVDFEDIIKQKAEEIKILEAYGLGVDPDTGEIASKVDINQNSDVVSDVDAANYVVDSERMQQFLMDKADAGDEEAQDLLDNML
ncbi:MAG: hypothetical protein DRN01_06980 [Thermoplasmata archaeon]|nr:MAG: hypothetical protein DRN01_06980 [Thermoplasmata archaeon]